MLLGAGRRRPAPGHLAYGAQLGGRGGRGVAHHPRRGRAEHGRGGADLAERGRVGHRLAGAGPARGPPGGRRAGAPAPPARGGVVNSSALRSPPVCADQSCQAPRRTRRPWRRAPRPRRARRPGRSRRRPRPRRARPARRRATGCQASTAPGRGTSAAAAAAPGPRRRRRGRPRGGCAELRLEELAVRDQRLRVGAVGGVEHLGHRRGEQLELVDEHHQRGLAAFDRPGVGPVARQPEVAADRLGEVVGRGGHHGVGVGAPPAQVAAAAATSRGWCGRSGRPGTARPPARCRRPASPRLGRATARMSASVGAAGTVGVPLACATPRTTSPRGPREPSLRRA